jgi:hypothetical protein
MGGTILVKALRGNNICGDIEIKNNIFRLSSKFFKIFLSEFVGIS